MTNNNSLEDLFDNKEKENFKEEPTLAGITIPFMNYSNKKWNVIEKVFNKYRK